MPAQATELTETAGEYSESETFNPETSNLVQHARRELQRLGIGDEDADYGGALEGAVMELIEVFARQGHSGYSAAMTISLFTPLARFEPLGDITSDPDEWTEVFQEMGEPHWQNTRRGTTFSRDGGKTWYDIDDARLNNGDTWFSQEETDRYLNDLGLDPDPTLVIDTMVKGRMWDELYELQRAYREEHGLPHDGSVEFNPELNRNLRKQRDQREQSKG